MMSWSKTQSWMLSLLTCMLTLGASGDDFDVWRVALPSAFAASEALLPLDDQNTDLIESTDPTQSYPSRWYNCRRFVAGLYPSTARVTAINSFPPPWSIGAGRQHRPCNERIAPLLC